CQTALTNEVYERVPQIRSGACPTSVRATALWLHLEAAAVWLVSAGAVIYWIMYSSQIPALLQYTDAIAMGAALGLVVGFFVRRIATDVARGESWARAKATILFALHLAAFR